MQSILITGCNRGLGLGLVKALVNSTAAGATQHIFATCRNPDSAAVIYIEPSYFIHLLL